MRRSAPFLLSAILAACSAQDAPKVPLVSHVVRHAVPGSCRIGPDGGPLIADRGIGGTGIIATGAPAAFGTQHAERGIGGTGIVGVVTGFASVCINGLEVQYDPTIAVDSDGTPAHAADLRVGQIVAITAAGPAVHPVASLISIRRELTGRIEGVAADTGLVTVAGQTVAVRSDTEGADRFGVGDWVSVSGFWRADGTVSATRIEAAPPGRLLAHGQVSLDGGIAKVGTLVLPSDQAAVVMPGQRVTVSGSYWGNTPRVSAVSRDMLLSDPAIYFGEAARHLVLQGFVQVVGGSLRLPGLEAGAAPGLRARVRRDEPAVIALERRPDGGYVATALRYADAVRTSSRRGRTQAGLAAGVSPAAAPASVMLNEPGMKPAAVPEAEPDLVSSLLEAPVWPPVTVSSRPHVAAPAPGAEADRPADRAAPAVLGTEPSVPMSKAIPPAAQPESGAHPNAPAPDTSMLIGSADAAPAAESARPHPAPRRGYAVASVHHRAEPVGPASISLVAQTVRPEKRSARHGGTAAPPAAQSPATKASD